MNKIDILRMEQAILLKELEYWKNYTPVNNMGKWSTQVRIASIETKLNKIDKRIKSDTNETSDK